MSSDERRRAPRHSAKVPVKARSVDGSSGYVISGESVNVSESGLLFVVDAHVNVGSKLELSFTVPAEISGAFPMKIRCSAHVVRVDKEGPGGKMGIAAHIDRYETIVADT